MVAPRAVEVVNTDGIRTKRDGRNEKPNQREMPTQGQRKPRTNVDHIGLGTKSEVLQKQPPPRPTSWLVVLQRELDQVKSAVQTEPHGSDLRMLLFTAAASSEEYKSTLVPLPPQFRATAGSGCQVERLRRAIAHNWPSCRVIPKIFNNEEELVHLGPDDIDALRLLHWLLLPHPTYPSLRRLSVLHLRMLCRTLGLACPTEEPRQLISIGYPRGGPQEGNWPQQGQREQGYQGNHAFLGLPLSQVYRFLYTGRLDIPPGEPIRLYTQLELALIHLEPESPPPQEPEEQSEGKNKSNPDQFCWITARKEQRSLIICQLPTELDEATASSPDQYYYLEFLVQDSTYLKPCYLLMYDEPVAAKMLLNWPGSPIETSPQPGRSLMHLYPRKLIAWAHYLGGKLVAFKRLIAGK